MPSRRHRPKERERYLSPLGLGGNVGEQVEDDGSIKTLRRFAFGWHQTLTRDARRMKTPRLLSDAGVSTNAVGCNAGKDVTNHQRSAVDRSGSMAQAGTDTPWR